MSNRLNVAVVGCGYWGMNYIRVFNELAVSHVSIVCDQQPSRLSEVKRRFPGIAVTTSLDDALSNYDVDIAVVCTQATSHYTITQRCIQAEKHVLVEKPITTIAAEAGDLIQQAEAKQLTLMVGHTFLYNTGVRKVKEYVANAEIGQIYYLYALRTNLGPIRKDVNALWDLAPHDISIFNYLLDSMPEWVSAIGSRILQSGQEDVGFISLGYPNGVVGHIHVSWADPNKVREVVVVGSEKRIVFNDLNALERVRVFEKGVVSAPREAPSYGEFQFLMRDGDIISPKVLMSEPLKDQCIHFLDCIKEHKQPLTDGRQGQHVVQVMEAIDRSIQRKGAPISLDEIPLNRIP